ncbi:MAG: hypothetical protein GC164_13635 [Phycisphaera sp.]|nr:hypothetical protein [Phycisphaera sp.]
MTPINRTPPLGQPIFSPIALTVALCIVAGPCLSQASAQDSTQRFDRTLEQIKRERELRAEAGVPTTQRALIDIGGYTGFSIFSFDDSSGGNHTLRQWDINLYTTVNIDNAHQLYVRGRFKYEDWNAGDDSTGDGDGWQATLERGVYRFDLTRALQAYGQEPPDFNVILSGGRQLIHWANGLTLSQDIDGADITLTTRQVDLEILAGVTREDTVDFDSSRPDFEDHTKRGFYGGMVRYRPVPEHQLFIYGLVQQDNNNHDFDPDPLAAARAADPMHVYPTLPTTFEYQSWYLGVGANGNVGDHVLYGVEAVYEGGTGLSNSFDATISSITQTQESISAFAASITLDYLFLDANRTRVSGQLLIATGDDDRALSTSDTFGGNTPGTDDTAFNGFGLVNTGLAFSAPVSNLIMVQSSVSTFPLPSSSAFKRVQVGASLFGFFKFDSGAPIDEPTGHSSYLGTEFDVFLNWQLLSDIAFTTRYGVFFPGASISGDRDARHFIYTALTLAF